MGIRNQSRRQTKDMLILLAVACLSCAGYLAASARTAGFGFPLDDAWIHHTFARNLAAGKGWSFQSGQLSGGSTGPAWGALLSLFHLSGFPPLWGSYLLGMGLLWATSATGYLLTKGLHPEKTALPLYVGSVLALEWHLVWAALSGMETILLAFLVMATFLQLIQAQPAFLGTGILVGLTAWVRPDGLTLAGPVLLAAVLRPGTAQERILRCIKFLAGLALAAGPYFVFNKAVSGDFWPNTFYAKQAEYAFLRQENFLLRSARAGKQLIVGVGAVLLPGLINEGRDIWQKRDWSRLGMGVWTLGYLGIYAWRLPVVYQHGRYLMPVMPVYFALGASGLLRWLKASSPAFSERVVSRATVGVVSAVLILFWLLGARAYARDVGVIETEIVQTALWIRDNTPGDSVIGAHDIGALGYFGERQVLDLAGLVSPDVISFIRDEDRLAVYLDRQSADYLMTFPGWYPGLVSGLEPIYLGRGPFVDLFDMEHVAVYAWK